MQKQVCNYVVDVVKSLIQVWGVIYDCNLNYNSNTCQEKENRFLWQGDMTEIITVILLRLISLSFLCH